MAETPKGTVEKKPEEQKEGNKSLDTKPTKKELSELKNSITPSRESTKTSSEKMSDDEKKLLELALKEFDTLVGNLKK